MLSELDMSPVIKDILQVLGELVPTECVFEDVVLLAHANFKCYQANMQILKIREEYKTFEDIPLEAHKEISGLEWTARQVGEQRVACKRRINATISEVADTLKKVKTPQEPESVTTARWDDIVFSVADMVDRLTIEFIKQADFDTRDDSDKLAGGKYLTSLVIQTETKRCLIQTINNIKLRGMYRHMGEVRTYEVGS